MPAGGHYLIKLLSCLQLFAHAKGLRQCQDLGAWRNLALFFFKKTPPELVCDFIELWGTVVRLKNKRKQNL